MWALAKKDQLWVKWISSIYLREYDFLNVQSKNSDSWHWKQLLKVRNMMADGQWSAIVNGEYRVSVGYEWLIGAHTRFRYAQVVWASYTKPSHSFILWLVFHRRLLTFDRMSN